MFLLCTRLTRLTSTRYQSKRLSSVSSFSRGCRCAGGMRQRCFSYLNTIMWHNDINVVAWERTPDCRITRGVYRWGQGPRSANFWRPERSHLMSQRPLNNVIPAVTVNFRPMTLTFELNWDSVKMNHFAKYLGQRSSNSSVILQTHRHTHLTDCSSWTTKVIIKIIWHFTIFCTCFCV